MNCDGLVINSTKKRQINFLKNDYYNVYAKYADNSDSFGQRKEEDQEKNVLDNSEDNNNFFNTIQLKSSQIISSILNWLD